MARFEKSFEQENWQSLHEKFLRDLLDAQAHLEEEIALQLVLVGLWESLLKPPRLAFANVVFVQRSKFKSRTSKAELELILQLCAEFSRNCSLCCIVKSFISV